MSSHIYGFDSIEHQWEPVHITSGKLKVESTLDTTGLATDTLQTAGNVLLASLDTKVTTCDTGNISGTVGVSGSVTVDGSGVTQPVSGDFYQATQPVSASALPLPTGAASETTLASLDGKVTVCDTSSISGSVAVSGVSGTVTVDGSGVTQPISAIALPLPTGAATYAEQLLVKQAITDSNDNNYDTEDVVVGVTSTADSSSYNVTNYGRVQLIAIGTVSMNNTHVQIQWSDDNVTFYHPSFYQTLSTSYGADGTSDAQETLEMDCPARAKYVRASLYNPSTTVSDTVKLVWARVH